MMFLEVPIVSNGSNEGKKLKPISINMMDVTDYREWVDEGKERTVFYFSKVSGKGKVVADVHVDKVHNALGTIKIEI
jgi:hypothetical protein